MYLVGFFFGLGFDTATITFISIVMALVIRGIEALGLIGDPLKMQGAFWGTISSMNDNASTIGLIVIGVIIVSWVISIIIYFLNRFDETEVNSVQ